MAADGLIKDSFNEYMLTVEIFTRFVGFGLHLVTPNEPYALSSIQVVSIFFRQIKCTVFELVVQIAGNLNELTVKLLRI